MEERERERKSERERERELREREMLRKESPLAFADHMIAFTEK